MWQYAWVPHPHRRPQRPTVTSPGWILHRRSVGWNLTEFMFDQLGWYWTSSFDNQGSNTFYSFVSSTILLSTLLSWRDVKDAAALDGWSGQSVVQSLQSKIKHENLMSYQQNQDVHCQKRPKATHLLLHVAELAHQSSITLRVGKTIWK